jgi:hypothetical protein
MMHAMTSPESMKAAADRDAYAVSGPGDARSPGDVKCAIRQKIIPCKNALLVSRAMQTIDAEAGTPLFEKKKCKLLSSGK